MMSAKLFVLACILALSQAYYIDQNSLYANSRIIGGEDAKPGEFPHLVSLQDRIDVENHFCAGSIINERWILTASHCLAAIGGFYERAFVKAGKHNITILSEPYEQVIKVEKYFMHENFTGQPESFAYDIGLMKLASPLKLNDRVAAIRLAKKDSEPTEAVILAGWGKIVDKPGAPVNPEILQKAKLDLVDRVTCSKTVVEFAAKYNVTVAEDVVGRTNFCTVPSTGGLSPCNGDSGGPVMRKNSQGTLELIGLVSYGTGETCGIPGSVAVYSNVASFIDWIHNIVSNN